jgi:hypothetical protein
MSKTNKKWFKKVRGSYIPNTWQGLLSYFPYVLYLVLAYYYSMVYYGYSLTSLFIIVPNWVAAVAVMTWIASKRS